MYASRKPTSANSNAGLVLLRSLLSKRVLKLLKAPPRMPRNAAKMIASFHSHMLPPWSYVPFALPEFGYEPTSVGWPAAALPQLPVLGAAVGALQVGSTFELVVYRE